MNELRQWLAGLSARERRIAKPYRYEEVVAILRSLDLL